VCILGNLSEQARESRDKILKSAEELFSDKGFDGVSVSEIAKTAGVNKALIYYYFKSKEDILNYLFKSFTIEITKIVSEEIKQELRHINEEKPKIENVANKFIDFILKRRKMFRVIVVESLKKGANSSLLFKFVECIDNDEIKNLMGNVNKECSGSNFDENSMKVDAFFMGFIPAINFAIYYDDWMAYNNMTEEEFKTTFVNIFKNSHESKKGTIFE
jgi:TetR/AcrR family transcriptional regulator